MKRYEYSWVVLSVDAINSTMIVEFTYDNSTHALNLPIPPANCNIDTHIRQHAPTSVWERMADTSAQESATRLLHLSGVSATEVLDPIERQQLANPNRGWLAFSEDPEVKL